MDPLPASSGDTSEVEHVRRIAEEILDSSERLLARGAFQATDEDRQRDVASFGGEATLQAREAAARQRTEAIAGVAQALEQIAAEYRAIADPSGIRRSGEDTEDLTQLVFNDETWAAARQAVTGTAPVALLGISSRQIKRAIEGFARRQTASQASKALVESATLEAQASSRSVDSDNALDLQPPARESGRSPAIEEVYLENMGISRNAEDDYRLNERDFATAELPDAVRTALVEMSMHRSSANHVALAHLGVRFAQQGGLTAVDFLDEYGVLTRSDEERVIVLPLQSLSGNPMRVWALRDIRSVITRLIESGATHIGIVVPFVPRGGGPVSADRRRTLSRLHDMIHEFDDVASLRIIRPDPSSDRAPTLAPL